MTTASATQRVRVRVRLTEAFGSGFLLLLMLENTREARVGLTKPRAQQDRFERVVETSCRGK